MARRSQLRIYTIHPETAEEWVGLFHEHIQPLREKHGFSVDAVYLSDDHTRFCWVTSHDCPDGWEAAEAVYYASPERNALPFTTSDYITDHDVTMVTPTRGY